MSQGAGISLDWWRGALTAVLGRECEVLHAVTVLHETPSTQDAARDAGAPVGTVVVAWRQTHGRGRLGRAWLDTGTDGVAVTAVLPAAAPERLAMLSAVATVNAVVAAAAPGDAGNAAPALCDAVGIKWPNDIVVGGRKLAGILVEQGAGGARVGIGVNVSQRAFAGDLAQRATSLAMEGVQVDRLAVLCNLVRALDACMCHTNAALARAFAARDRLVGTQAAFETPGGRVEGRVMAVEPLRGLSIATPEGEHFLPAATTSVVQPPA